MRVANNILELIGQTPMVKINKIVPSDGAEIYAKLEGFNPLGSVKDRIALNMVEQAEKQNRIKPGDTLIEPTSGNTGIGLSYVCAVKGYQLVLTMPETMSMERRQVLKAFGAKIELTEGTKGMGGAIEKAQQLAKDNNWFLVGQFENPANPDIHRKTTAIEIMEQIPDLDALVCGVGTGGTITGVAETIISTSSKSVKIVAVEPETSPVLSGGKPGPHKIQGIGAGFKPAVLNESIIDKVIRVTDEEAFQTARNLALKEGLFVGISSGAAMAAAIKLSKELSSTSKIVVVLPDHGERYLSTPLFSE
jgi:cysteine synthase A